MQREPNSLEKKNEFTDAEVRFLNRIVRKYSGDQRPLLRSVLIFSLMIVAAHLLERTPLPWWIVFPLIYLPALWLFSRYRRFAIFKTRLMRKLAIYSELVVEPTRTESEIEQR